MNDSDSNTLDILYGAQLLNGKVRLSELSNVLMTPFDKQLMYQNRTIVKKAANYTIENHDYTCTFTMFQADPKNKSNNSLTPLHAITPFRCLDYKLYFPLLSVQVIVHLHGLIEEHNILKFWMEVPDNQVHSMNVIYSGTIFMEVWQDNKVIVCIELHNGTDTKTIATLSEYARHIVNELDIMALKK